MKVKVHFPVPTNPEGNPVAAARNWKAIREQLLLDSDGTGGVEEALLKAAEAAKGPNHKVFVSRSYGRKGRLSVWIVDDRSTDHSRDAAGQHQKSGTGTQRDRRKALQEALSRVQL